MRIPLTLAVLLAMGTLAGCLDDGPAAEQLPETIVPEESIGYDFTGVDAQGLPVPLLLCLPMLPEELGLHASSERCNFLMTPDEGRQGNEVTIAVNPTDPRNVVGGAKDYYPADAGECVWDGVYVTHDGGRTTYEDRSFDGSPWRLVDGDPSDFQFNYASQFWCTTDPVAYFAVDGSLYYLLMAYQADRVTGSKTCEDICPTGALNDWAFNRAVQIVAKSTDGGDTFETFTPVLEGSFPIDFHDKGWVAASKDGIIHVMWYAALLPGNLYFRSTDGGASFSDPQVMSVTGGGALGEAGVAPAGQGSFVDVGTDNEVYATWTSGGNIWLRRSDDDGATFDAGRPVVQVHIAGMEGLSPRDRRGVSPMFATDRNPDSPNANALYYVWQDECREAWDDQCDGDGSYVWFSSSFDTGETFTRPVRVSKSMEVGEYELFPAISVSPGGVVDVSWMDTAGAGLYDCSDGKETDCSGYPDGQYPGFTQHYAYSLDGGVTWSEEFVVRDAPDAGWDPALSHHQNGMIFFGDYNDIDSSWQAAHPVWPDTRDGQSVKVYTATIQRPVFASPEKWDPAKLLAAQDVVRGQPLS